MARDAPLPAPVRLRQKRCGNCGAFAPEEKGFQAMPATCRKGLPTLLVTPQGIGGTWPPTKPEYFCRQWEALESDSYESNA